MDGEIIHFDSDLNQGDIVGADKRRYPFVTTDWRSAGQPARGNAVRFVANDDRATQIYLLAPAHLSPLSPSEAIDAVYRLALGRPDEDPFGAAPVYWRSYIAPLLILAAIAALTILFGGVPLDWSKLPFWLALLIFAFMVVAILIVFGLEIGIVALLGKMMGEPGRVGCGVLAYLWVESVLVQPGICVMRVILGPRDPTIVIVLLALGLAAVFLAAGRVVKSGFQLSNVGVGIFIVVAAGVVGFILDRVVG
jgi:hypothetical protein